MFSHELLTDELFKDLTKTSRKSLKWLELKAILQPASQKENFDTWVKAALKYSSVKPVFLSFVNLTTICPSRLFEIKRS